MVPAGKSQNIMFKKYFVTACLLALAVGFGGGCSRKAGTGSSTFNQAAPEIKQIWDQAVAADKANDYFNAITGYHSLMVQKEKLTETQVEALNAAALAINQRMYAAANNGDAAAKEASDKLVKMH